ncbi:hypothetical protein CXB51_022363 [Gossypium anomalum]|uniref:Retrovirus-related Pol polyprotein from transposon TNT 1-94-like beta-barrel domain-containing protein n=1 Tax=Gossypium anomalum TaxID=47600 RepID=A0A8J5Y6Y7_9ROSI|nr:hypothetical protein CXB51_022363 [Gossypium anomalum]
MATTRFEIEKFDGETNFNLWQVRMMAILVQSGLKKVVTGKKPENLNKTEWEELDEKALSAIQLCLANTVLQEVLMEKTSSSLWKRLETLYATKSLANRLVLKQRLFTFRMNESELLKDHISQFITLLNDLNNVEVHIDDEDQAMLLLCSLPPSYKSFRETLIYGRDKLSFEDVKSNEEDVAGANLADENGDYFLLVSTSDNTKLTSEWILDSGCSFHMCPNREWFSTYSSVEGGVVRMGNDSSSKVIGIGTVKIKMHDGTIKTLSDVRYVPDLRKNLISLSILDLKGCKINIKSSGIKVSCGALVLLKGKRIGSLYILEGSTVTGEIGRPSSVTELKSTCLERRQLGHRREKGMTISLKRCSLLDAGFEKLGHCVRENQTRPQRRRDQGENRPLVKNTADPRLSQVGSSDHAQDDAVLGAECTPQNDVVPRAFKNQQASVARPLAVCRTGHRTRWPKIARGARTVEVTGNAAAGYGRRWMGQGRWLQAIGARGFKVLHLRSAPLLLREIRSAIRSVALLLKGLRLFAFDLFPYHLRGLRPGGESASLQLQEGKTRHLLICFPTA